MSALRLVRHTSSTGGLWFDYFDDSRRVPLPRFSIVVSHLGDKYYCKAVGTTLRKQGGDTPYRAAQALRDVVLRLQRYTIGDEPDPLIEILDDVSSELIADTL